MNKPFSPREYSPSGSDDLSQNEAHLPCANQSGNETSSLLSEWSGNETALEGI